MCPNQATYKVKTQYGTYHMCSHCIQNGHMLVDNPDYTKTPKIPLGANFKYQCECEHYSHN